jgi:hypothetical protein
MLLWVSRLNKRVPTKLSWQNMRKRALSGPSEDTTGDAQPKYRLVHSNWQVTSCTSTTTVGSSPTSAVADVTTDTCPFSSACITSCISAKDGNSQSPVLQLQTSHALCSAVAWIQEGQSTKSSSINGNSTERASQGPNTKKRPCQPHHSRGYSLERRSTCGYFLTIWASYHHHPIWLWSITWLHEFSVCKKGRVVSYSHQAIIHD